MDANFKIHQLNEAHDIKLMTESKRILNEMMHTENRIYQNGKDMFDQIFQRLTNLESNQKIQANNSIPVAKPQVCELAPDANLLSQARLISEEPGHEHLYALPRFSNVEKPQVSKLVPDADVLSQARLISKEPGHEHLYALPRFSNFENDNDHFEGGDFENYDAVDFEAELNGYIDHSPNLI
jgi:hypothetical protein